ncbi:MAG: CHAD domain-containing protein [Gemmatimonadetes bacterium]|nr:CHAD domain-containing protein [Gemmatimonadota bacterium]
MPRLPTDFLERTPEEAARLLALAFLKEGADARLRLTNPDDVEALHDFRVAIRRLRSCLRAFRPYLRGSVSKKMRRRIRSLTTATNAARDLEVMVTQMRETSTRLDETGRAGVDWLMGRMQADRADALQRINGEVLAPFDALEPRLRKRLSRFETTVHLVRRSRHPSFGRIVGDLTRRHAGELREHLAAVRGREDEEQAHRARISAKRLRYLLEPLTRRRKRAKALVVALKSLQDLLGEIRDTQVMAREITAAVEQAAAHEARRAHQAALGPEAPAPPRETGSRDLVGLARLAEQHLVELFAQLQSEWLGGRAEPLLRRLERLGESLASRRPRHVEIERKFLLTGVPEIAREVVPLEIDQGWIAGQMVSERVRRTRAPGSENYSRTIKLGEGLVRSEFEEPMTPDVFETLWPLTARRRISKRRYPVPDGDRVWEIDEFTDRELVLAEVELDAEQEEVTPPEWLKPYVVREVTGEPEYVNVNLAR